MKSPRTEGSDRLRAARQRVESYISRLRGEIEHFKFVINGQNETLVRNSNELSALRTELASLKERQLTEQELDDLDSCIGDSLFGFERRSDDLDDDDIAYVERCTALREKISALRLLSTSDSEQK